MTKILLAMFALIGESAYAQSTPQIPNYDVKASCSEIARAVGTSSQVIMQGCLQNEQSSYNSLKANWNKIPPEMRKGCDEVSRAAGSTYQILLGCIQNEQAAANSNNHFQFKR